MSNALENRIEDMEKYNNITTGVEFETGRIIDGKKEYGKRIDIGNLPNNNTKLVAHGLTNVTFTRPPQGFTKGAVVLPLPYVAMAGSATGMISLDIVNSDLRIYVGVDRSYMTAVVDLYYTKN